MLAGKWDPILVFLCHRFPLKSHLSEFPFICERIAIDTEDQKIPILKLRNFDAPAARPDLHLETMISLFKISNIFRPPQAAPMPNTDQNFPFFGF